MANDTSNGSVEQLTAQAKDTSEPPTLTVTPTWYRRSWTQDRINRCDCVRKMQCDAVMSLLEVVGLWWLLLYIMWFLWCG